MDSARDAVMGEHGPDSLLISCSSNEAAIRAQVASIKPPSVPFFVQGFIVRRIVRAAIAEPLLARGRNDPTTIPRLQQVVDT